MADPGVTLADAALFTLGVLAWTSILVGSVAAVAVVLALIDLWKRR